MAVSVIDTHIQNPASRGGGKNMARKMSAKQIRFFGSKRQKAALRAKRARPAKKHAHRNTARKTNTARSRPKTSHRSRTAPRPRRKNPELVSFLLGNSAHKGAKTVAHSKKKTKKRAVSQRSNAGTRRSKPKAHSYRSKAQRGNPGSIGSPKTWVMGGAGALAGFVGSAAIPQLILGTGNTGVTGYAVTAGAAIGLGLLSHFLLPRQQAVTFGVVAGGFANLLRRIISDQTPFGQYVSGTGMGDYMVANWGPPRMTNGLFSAMAESPGTPWGSGPGGGMISSSGVGIQDMADIRSARPC